MIGKMLPPPAVVEALLFVSSEPLEKKRLSTLLDITETELEGVLQALADSLKGRGLTLMTTHSVVELRTAPEATPILKKLREQELSRDLGPASLETLAVIAYQAPASRSEIDWVRGVNSSAALRTLLLRGLIEGEEDKVDKRRIRYHLTTEAFAHLGISNESELPRATELQTAASAIVSEKASADDTVSSV